ncbi:hypothetical protein [Arthrobacter wenxiniae]|uniref:DUF732 domain-containing protein n=1 Tax=Arthrobacter wenxiniae TaxID=2713570 RepID=A0A7Y7IIJ2_9MICC|nr:hypothetical protein [Arthrobacter wenxiniae]NVM96092.1 hypothetical protein [Arthrobacter wenxiniae]
MKKLATTGAALLLVTVLSGCGGAADSASPAVSTSTAMAPAPTVTVQPTPTPAPNMTTGSYEADLAALGVVPDNVQSFADYMEAEICNQTGTGLGVSVRSIGGNPTGGGMEGVRLTVAYFCPEKSQEVESYLDYFKN